MSGYYPQVAMNTHTPFATPGMLAEPKMHRVVIVDEHEATRIGVRHLLEQEPTIECVGEATEPTSALELVVRVKPDVVIIDLAFASGNGFDLIRDLRLNCPTARVIVHTAMDRPGYAERSLRAGAVGFVAKSEPVSSLVRACGLTATGTIYLSEGQAGRLLSRLAGGQDPTADPVERLSEGEFRVFHMIAQGFSSPQIASTMCRSIKTIETYRSRIKRKLGVQNATELAQFAARRLDLATPMLR